MPRSIPEIHFQNEDVRFRLNKKTELKSWLNLVARSHKQQVQLLLYHFVSDDYLLEMNKKFLMHNTLTDIITFDLSEQSKGPKKIQGEIFISVDRVADNADKFGVTKTEELHRVMAHGLLHLCGFGDKTTSQHKRMRREEENALALRKFKS
jgi:rRNA maturation RNase YbeY